MKFAILGLGEAGGALADDLLERGAMVSGWDPEPKNIPEGVHFAASNPEAAREADVILSVNWASVSVEVAG
jgi:3-hydroxyisobutyrate dehydrogenase-like beta-hydroxyacid dehydrogenase